MRVIYHGCGERDDGGHFFWGTGVPKYKPPTSFGHVDGAVQPGCHRSRDGRWQNGSTEPDGRVRVTRHEGWTFLGWWDRSSDSRPASNSVILIEDATIGFDDALALGREHFPWVFTRFGKPLRQELPSEVYDCYHGSRLRGPAGEPLPTRCGCKDA